MNFKVLFTVIAVAFTFNASAMDDVMVDAKTSPKATLQIEDVSVKQFLGEDWVDVKDDLLPSQRLAVQEAIKTTFLPKVSLQTIVNGGMMLFGYPPVAPAFLQFVTIDLNDVWFAARQGFAAVMAA